MIDDLPHTPADCPAPGTTTNLDGYFASADSPFFYAAGTEVMIFAGCNSFGTETSGPYTLRIENR